MDRNLEREREETEEQKSKIESARDRLYQQGAPSVIHRQYEDHPAFADDEQAPPQAFVPPKIPDHTTRDKVAGKINKIFRRLLMVAIIFFVIALGAATFLYFYGNNIISSRNITLDIVAPSSVPSSDTFSYDVSVQNGNTTDLIDAAIVVDYPEGTRYVDDNTKPLVSERIEIGTLHSGEIIKRTISARLFGEENAEKEIRVSFEYQVENSNAHFSKDDKFNVILRLAPVVLSIDALKEVNNNQEVVLVAKVISNSNNTLNNVALNVEYPFGFTYTASNMEIESGKSGQFPLGTLKSNETKTVEIRGIINGQSNEDKVFKFNVGTARADDLDVVTTSLAQFVQQTTIRGDFLSSSIVLNDSSGVARLGTAVRGSIVWKNTLPDPINNVKFTLKIDGELIDTQNISSDRGYYDSNSSVIEWDKGVDKTLEEIAPGQTGNFAFSISLKSLETALAERITNPRVTLVFDVEGRRITENDVTENIRSSFTKTIPVVTSVIMEAKSLHVTGPISNEGPVPPKSENKTTYTVALSLSNTVNEITNGQVTAKLPNYVSYEGEISPGSEKVTWNQSERQLRWTVGNISPRVGYGSNPRTLYFKVGITPSQTQIGQVLQLVNNIVFSGRDEFANIDIKANSNSVTTNTADSGTSFGNGQVVQ